MLDLFPDSPTPEAPTLASLVQSGDVLRTLAYIENLSFDSAYQTAIESGFWVAGSKKDKRAFYEFLGPQLRDACIARVLPAPTPWSFGLADEPASAADSV